TIEDAAELQLQQPHVVILETRPANLEGKGEISIRTLVKNSLRMRPDRIVIGEVRSGEALDMLQAMNTGHDGGLSTLHSNTPRGTGPLAGSRCAGGRAPGGRSGPAGARSPPPPPGWRSRPACRTGAARLPTSPRSRAWRATRWSCRTSSSCDSAALLRTERC